MSLKEIKADIASQKRVDEEKKKKRQRKGLFDKQSKNTILNSILFMLFTTIAGACIMYYIQQNLTSLNVYIDNEYVSSDTLVVLNTKKYIDAISTAKLKDISNELTNDIYNNLDMGELKNELTRGEISPTLESMFRNAILDECSIPGMDKDINNIFICNSKGILADYSNIYATDNEKTRTWEVESSRQQNIELFNNSIQSMIKQDVTNIFVEESVIDDKSGHKVLSSMSERDLENIIKTEGIEGIRNYTFLVPVYIMDNNDIFGTNDIIDGHRVENNKFILVQRYNLYDYICMYHIDEQFDHNSVDYKFETLYTLIYLFMIIYFISILIFISYSIIILNRSMDEQTQNNSWKNVDRNAKITDIDPYAMTGRRAYDKYSAEIIRLLQEERQRNNIEKEKAAVSNIDKSSDSEIAKAAFNNVSKK